VLAPEDLLLHLSLQTSHGDRFSGKLKCLCDIDHAVQFYEGTIDWQWVGQRAREWGASHAVYLTLRLAKELLGTAVPDAALRRLEPASFDPRLVAWATDRLLERRQYRRVLGPKLVRVWQNDSHRDQVRSLLAMAFPAPEVVAASYDVSPRSKRVYWFYLVRLKQEFFRTRRTMGKLLLRDGEVTEIAEEDKVLAEWLEEE